MISNPTQRLSALRPVPIFGGLARNTLLEIARRTTEVVYGPGATIVREGDPGDSLCIIVRGSVEVVTRGRQVARMGEGEFFGEISLIDGKPRSATVRAVGEVVLYELSSSDFTSLLSLPHVAHAALVALAARVREAHAAYGRGEVT